MKSSPLEYALTKTAFLDVKSMTSEMGNSRKFMAASTLLAGYGLAKVIDKIRTSTRRTALIEDLMMNDPIIKGEDPKKVMQYYATIYSVAPSVSLDKNTVQEILQNFIKFGRVDLQTINTLSGIEKNITDAGSKNTTGKTIGALMMAAGGSL